MEGIVLDCHTLRAVTVAKYRWVYVELAQVLYYETLHDAAAVHVIPTADPSGEGQCAHGVYVCLPYGMIGRYILSRSYRASHGQAHSPSLLRQTLRLLYWLPIPIAFTQYCYTIKTVRGRSMQVGAEPRPVAHSF